jgi:hypothetical protein
MAGDWFLARPGQQTVGPITAQQLKQLATSGQVQAADLVWKQGLTRWVPANQIKGLLDKGAPVRAPEPPGARVLDWRTQEPQPLHVEPAPVEPAPVEPAPEPAEEPFAVPEPLPSGPPVVSEPWYYGFLGAYATLAMWLELLASTFVLVLFLIYVFRANMQLETSEGTTAFLLSFLTAVPVYAFVVIFILFKAAMILLAVDAGRNLQALRERAGEQTNPSP